MTRVYDVRLMCVGSLSSLSIPSLYHLCQFPFSIIFVYSLSLSPLCITCVYHLCSMSNTCHVCRQLPDAMVHEQARNKLLEQVRARGKHYIYYIFTDDDTSLTLRPSSVPPGHQTSVLDHPWREFERLLLLWQPAAGSTP